MVTSDEHTSDLARADLRHVENDDGGDETDTETCNETTSNKETKSVGGDLENDTDNVDTATSDDSRTTSNNVCHITGDDSAKEGTSRKDRDDERVVGRSKSGCTGAFNDTDEDRGASDTVDVSRVITEEHASERCESAEL